MSVRAKFKVDSIQEFESFLNVTMSPVNSLDPAHENKRFWDATPSGQIVLGVNNKAVFEGFKPGSEVYVEFTQA